MTRVGGCQRGAVDCVPVKQYGDECRAIGSVAALRDDALAPSAHTCRKMVTPSPSRCSDNRALRNSPVSVARRISHGCRRRSSPSSASRYNYPLTGGTLDGADQRKRAAPEAALLCHGGRRGLIVAGLAGRREHVRVHSGRSHPAVVLGLHGDRSNQRDGNSDPTQGEPQYPETFLVGHPQFPFPLSERLAQKESAAYDVGHRWQNFCGPPVDARPDTSRRAEYRASHWKPHLQSPLQPRVRSNLSPLT